MHVSSLVNSSLKKSAIFGLVLASADLLGFCQRVGFSSRVFTEVSIMDGYLPSLGLFILQGAFPTSWTFGKILRTPLHSWGFPFQSSLSGVLWIRI